MEDTTHSEDNAMLIDIVKSVAVLTAEFKNFKYERSEDNSEVKASIKEIKDDVKSLTNDVTLLKSAPAKAKAEKWDSVVKLILDMVLTTCLVAILVKIGLK